MERFTSQLYEKYINLKKRKFSEIEDIDKKRISETLQYQSATELLIEDLKTENDKLRVKIVSMQEQYQESQELLLKERQKTNALSSEVNTLKKTLAEKIDNLESASLRSPCGKSSIRLEDSNQCLPMKNNLDTPSGQNPIQSENAAITLHEIDNENRLVFHDEPMIESLQPDCCRRTKSNYGTGTDRSCNPCAFHTLVELLVGMKISMECQTEGPCFSVIHQMSDCCLTEICCTKMYYNFLGAVYAVYGKIVYIGYHDIGFIWDDLFAA
ncbi:hypothetical protein IEQ34_012562 [Dendrobium chrysotoxum]|uniref:DUF7806 domain-containing protein n=1 Tax=Dendrobium chrysotoxum TaxID=161865 RepID=A0AAV7GVP7_DENCH|nr:hypothetical protein IEQ34_012562 [Dendrobium chrysotoxum]